MNVNWRRVGVALGMMGALYLVVLWYGDPSAVMRSLLPDRWAREGPHPEDVSILAVLFLMIVLAAAWSAGPRR